MSDKSTKAQQHPEEMTNADPELSDEDLEDVAGGTSTDASSKAMADEGKLAVNYQVKRRYVIRRHQS